MSVLPALSDILVEQMKYIEILILMPSYF